LNDELVEEERNPCPRCGKSSLRSWRRYGPPMTSDEIVTAVCGSYDGKEVVRRDVESALTALFYMGEVLRDGDRWKLCPIEKSLFDYTELAGIDNSATAIFEFDF
jgi:hypothetical protein